MSPNEEAAIKSVGEILLQIQGSVDKRQYLNAADSANMLVGTLLSALSSVLKEARDILP